MATPAWVRQHRRLRTVLTTIALLELSRQAEERVEVEHDTEPEWSPRRGMTFASD